MMSDHYRQGYYDGWLAALYQLDELSTRYAQQYEREGTYLIEDGSLHGDSVHLAYGKAEEDCQRYAYDLLQKWLGHSTYQEEPPPFPQSEVEGTAVAPIVESERLLD